MATATAAGVKHFENLSPQKIAEIKKQYNKYICGDEQYWHEKADSQTGLLVRLKDIRPIEPIRIKKADWRAWVVLTKKENFGLLANI